MLWVLDEMIVSLVDLIVTLCVVLEPKKQSILTVRTLWREPRKDHRSMMSVINGLYVFDQVSTKLIIIGNMVELLVQVLSRRGCSSMIIDIAIRGLVQEFNAGDQQHHWSGFHDCQEIRK